jgi:hypothetical protein
MTLRKADDQTCLEILWVIAPQLSNYTLVWLFSSAKTRWQWKVSIDGVIFASYGQQVYNLEHRRIYSTLKKYDGLF